jgi:hypothetical protein
MAESSHFNENFQPLIYSILFIQLKIFLMMLRYCRFIVTKIKVCNRRFVGKNLLK